MKSFKVILQHTIANTLSIHTIEECIDVQDCISFVYAEFPDHEIIDMLNGDDGTPVVI